VHPAPNAVLSLATDASDTHVGGVLQQLNGGSWQPLEFYSKKLSGVGTRYSTFDRELLAAFSAVRHFRFLLEGRQFRLLINHKPLVTSLFRRLIAARFCWPQMAKAIFIMARACLHCHRGKSQTRTPTASRDTGTPPLFTHIHVNLVGPLPPSGGHTYLFTIID
jgi:hypothetical protein